MRREPPPTGDASNEEAPQAHSIDKFVRGKSATGRQSTACPAKPDDILLPGVTPQMLPEHLRKRVRATFTNCLVLDGSELDFSMENYVRELEAELSAKALGQKKRTDAATLKRIAKAELWRGPMLAIAKANRPPYGNLPTPELTGKIRRDRSMKALVSDIAEELKAGKKLRELPSRKTLKNHIKSLEDDGELQPYDKSFSKVIVPTPK